MNRYVVYQRRVAYHETDAMGVMHHSNHVKYFEEARVAWLRERGWAAWHTPQVNLTFAVAGLEIRYRKPLRFDEEIQVWVRARREGLKVVFEYALLRSESGELLADGRTIIVPVDGALKPIRLPTPFDDIFSQEPWEGEWPLVDQPR